MPPLIIRPLINGKNYDWNNLVFAIFGIPLVRITEINFSEKQQKVMNYGIGNKPISYGTQNFMYEGDISVYQEELRDIQLTVPSKTILDIPPITAILTYSGDGVKFAVDTLQNILFTENVFAAKQNDASLITKIPFVFAGLIRK